jgi:hypothetical protein
MNLDYVISNDLIYFVKLGFIHFVTARLILFRFVSFCSVLFHFPSFLFHFCFISV